MIMLLSRHKIKLKGDPKFSNETYKKRWQRVLEIKDGVIIA